MRKDNVTETEDVTNMENLASFNKLEMAKQKNLSPDQLFEQMEKAKQAKLDSIVKNQYTKTEILMQDLLNQVHSVRTEINRWKAYEKYFRFFSQSLSDKVYWWSVINFLCLIGVRFGQSYYMQKFFIKNKIN